VYFGLGSAGTGRVLPFAAPSRNPNPFAKSAKAGSTRRQSGLPSY